MTLILGKNKSSITFNNTAVGSQSTIETLVLTNLGSGIITGTHTMPPGFKIKDPSTGLWVSTLAFTLHAYIEDKTGSAITDNAGEELWGVG